LPIEAMKRRRRGGSMWVGEFSIGIGIGGLFFVISGTGRDRLVTFIDSGFDSWLWYFFCYSVTLLLYCFYMGVFFFFVSSCIWAILISNPESARTAIFSLRIDQLSYALF